MLAEDLRTQLAQHFDLVTFTDLADYRQRHRSIFDLFGKAHQERFAPNQRFVLYSEHEPEQDFLDHIQRAATRIDISNYFIVIVCPYDISKKLLNSNLRFGCDDSVMQSMSVPLRDTKPFDAPGYAKTNSLCPLPFAQVEIDPGGNVRPCCKFDGIISSLNQNSLAEIFFSPKLNKVRQQMIKGEHPPECMVCWQNEAKGTTSFRELSLKKYADLLDRAWLDDVKIRDLTWSPTILCNFACRICHPGASSTVAVEELTWCNDASRKNYLQILIKDHTKSEINIDTMFSPGQLDQLEYLHIMGGEPFVWPQLPSVIDFLTKQDLAKKIKIEFNTNVSVYPGSILQRIIENFKSVEILLSIDNVGKRFEVERGGKWSDIFENAKKFADLRSPTVKIKIALTVNLQNVLYLDDVIKLAESLDIDIVFWYLEIPEFLCIDRGTDQTKQLVVSRYLQHANTELQKIAMRMQDSPGSDGRDFIAYTEKIDKRRAQQFFTTHLEIYEAMGGRV